MYTSQQRLPDIISALCLSGAAFLVVMDITIANIAVPVIAGYFGVSAQQGLWIITSFGVTHAISMLLTGWLVDRFGETRIFFICFTVFVLSSFGCGTAFSIESLVMFRAVQGAAAGPVLPLTQSLLLKGTPYRQRGQLLSLWSGCVVLAPLIGPVTGGYLCEHFSWQWLFLINIPLGIITLLCFYRRKQPFAPHSSQPCNPDLISLILLIFVALLWQGLAESIKQTDTDNLSFKVFVYGCIFLTLFSFLWEGSSRRPVIHLSILGSRHFLTGIIIWILSYAINFGSLLPLLLSDVYGYTPLLVGLVCAPSAIAPIMFSGLVGRLSVRWDPRIILGVSFIMFAAVFFWRSGYIRQETTYSMVSWSFFVQGVASVLFFIPLTMITYSEISDEDMAKASTLCCFIRTLTGSIGTTLTYLIWDYRSKFHMFRFSEMLQTHSDSVRHYIDKYFELGIQHPEMLSILQKNISNMANIQAINDLFWLNGYLFIGMLPTIIFLKTAIHHGNY